MISEMRMKTLALLLMAALPLSGWAARPFVTDDARLTTAGSCQLESWARLYRHSTELWALPACNPLGNLEITLGGGGASIDGQPYTRDEVLQLKTLFRDMETNGWGWGLAVGTVRHPAVHPGPNLLGNRYAYVPVSMSFPDDEVVVHANLGWIRDRASRQHSVSWGLGAEWHWTSRLTAMAEGFGDHRTRPYVQAGLRLSIVPDRLQLDTTVGQQWNAPHAGRWISFGLRFTPDRLW